jgi:DNA-binding transcriptional LysR family regulator
MVDLRHLRYFVTTAELLNFTHAAEKLLVTQPTLSESIRELEADLGTELFIRSTRRVRLSWPGEILLGESRRILRLIDDAIRLTREAADADAVTLRLGVIEEQDPGILSRALARCRYLLPRFQTVVYVLPTVLQLRALEHNQIDLAIVIGPVAMAGITCELLWSEPLVAALPRGHSMERRSNVTVTELRDEVLVLPDRAVSPGYHDLLIELCRANGFDPKCTEQTFHFEIGLSEVASGLGIAFVPGSIDVTRQPDITAVPLIDGAAVVPVMAARRSDDASSALLAFIAALRSSRLSMAPDASRVSPTASPSSSSVQPASGQKRGRRR